MTVDFSCAERGCGRLADVMVERPLRPAGCSELIPYCRHHVPRHEVYGVTPLPHGPISAVD